MGVWVLVLAWAYKNCLCEVQALSFQTSLELVWEVHLFIFSNELVVYMSRLIEKSISTAYGIVHQAHLESFGLSSSGSDLMETTNSSVNRSFIDLPKELFQMLACVGPYFYCDTILLQKVHYFVFNIIVSCKLTLNYGYYCYGTVICVFGFFISRFVEY